jgi:hypothetical protein
MFWHELGSCIGRTEDTRAPVLKILSPREINYVEVQVHAMRNLGFGLGLRSDHSNAILGVSRRFAPARMNG